MSSWQEFSKDAPDFAARVRAVFDLNKHKTLGTLRADGSPRLSGIELDFTDDGRLQFGSMPDSAKGRDLERDPRMAVHSNTPAPDEDNPAAWPGDAKLSGLAHAAGPTPPDGPEGTLFTLDVTEVVLTYIAPDAQHLVIESWHESRGHQLRQRT
jgi:hypothetical protein